MNLKSIVSILFLICISFCFVSCAPKKNVQEKKEVSILEEEIAKAQQQEEKGDYVQARKIYKEIFTKLTEPQDIEKIKKRIEDLNIKILFSKVMDEGSFFYKVKAGDSLNKIAKRFNTTVELIKKANGLKSDIIRVGDKLKVTKAKFSIVIDKSQNLLFLKKDDEVFKTYVVSTGKNNSTPTGSFKIITKIKNPVWFRKDVGAVVPPSSPKNVLGSRWLGLDIQGYGIHGTSQPNNLGKQTTRGCIRMKNEDVEELFSILPRRTEVTIVD